MFTPFVSVRMRFLSVSRSANAFLVRRGPFNPAESFVHAQNLERTLPGKAVCWLYICCSLGMRFVRNLCVPRPVLVSSHSLMSGGPDSRPDYYLTCNG